MIFFRIFFSFAFLIHRRSVRFWRRTNKCYRRFCLLKCDKTTVVPINHTRKTKAKHKKLTPVCEVHKWRKIGCQLVLIAMFVCRSTMFSTIVELGYDILAERQFKTPLHMHRICLFCAQHQQFSVAMYPSFRSGSNS